MTTTKLKLTSQENYLLLIAVVNSPLKGLRLSDLPKVEEVKRCFKRSTFDGEIEVEIPTDGMPYVRAAWASFPLGEVPRTDDLPAVVDSINKKITVPESTVEG